MGDATGQYEPAGQMSPVIPSTGAADADPKICIIKHKNMCKHGYRYSFTCALKIYSTTQTSIQCNMFK